jgi:serine/threonine protein kinase
MDSRRFFFFNSDLIVRMPEKKFSVSTVINFALQSLEALQTLHERGFIHRDIKMANFMVGRGAEGATIIYLIDFGLVKMYATPEGVLYPVCLNFLFF